VHCPPRISIVPEHVRSAGRQIVAVARMAGIDLDEEQRFLAEATSGVDAAGKWTAFEAVMMGPRQSLGKTEYLLARVLAGLYLFGEELIVFSAHRASTTTKAFRRLRRAIDRSPQLGARIARVSNRIGSERIELGTGQAVEMVARSTSSGRGFTGDCLCLDEAHELDADQLSAILPMLATRPNPQVIYALSMGNEQSSHLGGLRERALGGAGDVAWLEWSMADGDDIADRRVWIACNSGYPSRITLEYMEKEFAALGSERFARERLGRSEWPSGEAGEWMVISQAAWDAAASPSAEVGSVPEPVAVAAPPVSEPEKWPDGVPEWVRRRGQPPANSKPGTSKTTSAVWLAAAFHGAAR
jgi:hypothetical protein